MKRTSNLCACFSLIEVTLALGVAAISLIAIFGLLPIGAETSRNATSQTAAINILANLTADIRATPSASAMSTQYNVTFGIPQTLYFDELGGFTSAPTSESKYRVDLAYPTGSGLSHAPLYVRLAVRWPAQANPANATGTAQLFAAFDRH
jgi:uncharacterized protein (TIGR02598 family)